MLSAQILFVAVWLQLRRLCSRMGGFGSLSLELVEDICENCFVRNMSGADVPGMWRGRAVPVRVRPWHFGGRVQVGPDGEAPIFEEPGFLVGVIRQPDLRTLAYWARGCTCEWG